MNACRRQLPAALEVVGRTQELPCLGELRALAAVLLYKRALYHLATLSFADAARGFAQSQAVYKAAGRRSLAPAMAMNAAHCHIISGDLEAAAAMMEEVAAYRALNKTNWVPQDRVAFRVLGEFEARHAAGEGGNEAAMKAWSLLHQGTAMCIFQRCTLWMDDAAANAFAAMLDGAQYTSADDRAKAAMVIAQMHAQRGELVEGLAVCAAGLALGSELGEASSSFGTMPMLHYLHAHLLVSKGELHKAEVALQACHAATARGMVLAHFLSFKTARLRRALGLQLSQV